MAITFKLVFVLYILRISWAEQDDEDDPKVKQKWYDYNSLFIRYGYQANHQGRLQLYEVWDNMMRQLTLQDYMQGRGVFFHPSLYWKPKGDTEAEINYMFSFEQPPNETLFEYAKNEIEANTCIKFKQVTESTTMNCHAKGETDFICVYGEEGTCAAEYGQNLTKPALFSVSSGCGKRGVLHEMGHVLGLQHAQSRFDRGAYIDISFKNIGHTNDDMLRRAILSEYQKCANSHEEKLKMPYDYTSIMHTGILDWSDNFELIMIPRDPRHLYMIDYVQDYHPHLSHYDKLLLNTIYGCKKRFGKKCGSKSCDKLGYLAKNCTCVCPKGTYGATCSSSKSSTDVYDIPESPACYREVTAEDDSFTLKYAGLVAAKVMPFTQHCIIVVTSGNCKLPMITVDSRVAMLALKPKISWWFNNDVLSCSYFSLFYNVTGMHTRNICWDQLADRPVYWIFSRQSKTWLFARFRDQEMTAIAGKIKLYFHSTGDYRCKLGNNDIFDAVNAGRMRSVGGAAESAKAMAIILPAVVVCLLLVLGFVYWKFIRSPMVAENTEAEDGEPAEGADVEAEPLEEERPEEPAPE